MESYGYRFDTPDRSIVISGDTNPTQETIDACRGCDVLIHEAITPALILGGTLTLWGILWTNRPRGRLDHSATSAPRPVSAAAND